MKAPRRAMILAAGFGTRLAPLTHTLPKALLPLWGRPILAGLLDRLAAWGVRDALINLHHTPQPLFDYLRTRALSPAPPRLHLSFEPDILGTGGALRPARWFLDDAPFWLLNADIALATSPAPLIRAFARQRPLAVLLMHRQAGPRTVALAPDGRVLDFACPQPGRPDTATFCGLQLLAPRILDHLPDTPCFSIVDAYRRGQAAGETVLGIAPPQTYWADIGTPEGLLAAHAQTAAARRAGRPGGDLAAAAPATPAGTARGFVSLAPGVRAPRRAALRNVVALPGVRIAPGARIHDAILGPGVAARGDLTRLAVRLDQAHDPLVAHVVHTLGGAAAHTLILPLAPRGSSRDFTRLTDGRHDRLLVRYRLDRPENARFTGHARALAALGIRVPRILLDRPESCYFVMEYIKGIDVCASAADRTPAARRRLYAPVIAAVAHWHRVAGPAARRRRLALEPAFGPRLYAWEHALFQDHYLGRRLGWAPATGAEAAAELRAIARRLHRSPGTLVHRDLQATNILLPRGGPVFIDFQGMRLGPALYDLASLLADPYVSLDPDTQQVLLQAYRRAVADSPLADFEDTTFWEAAVQRLVQAIGAYGRLSRLPGTAAFARHIPPALEMLDRALRRLYTAPALLELVARARQAEKERCGNA